MAVDYHYSYDYEYDYEDSKLRHSKDSTPQSMTARREESRSNRKSNIQSSSTRSSKCSREKREGDEKNRRKRDSGKSDDRWGSHYCNKRKVIGILDCTKKGGRPTRAMDDGALKKYGQSRTNFMEQVTKHPVYGEKAVPPGDLSNAVYPCESRSTEIEDTFAEAAISHVFNCRSPKPGQMNHGRYNLVHGLATSAKGQLEEVRSGFTALHHRSDAVIPGMKGYDNYIRWKNGFANSSFLDDSDFSTEATDEDIANLKEGTKSLLLDVNSDSEDHDRTLPSIVIREGKTTELESTSTITTVSSTSSLSTSDSDFETESGSRKSATKTTIETVVTETCDTTVSTATVLTDDGVEGPVVSMTIPSTEMGPFIHEDESMPRNSVTTIGNEVLREVSAPRSSMSGHESVPVSINQSIITSNVSNISRVSVDAGDSSIASVNAGEEWKYIHYSGVSEECPYTIRTKRIEEGTVTKAEDSLLISEVETIAPSTERISILGSERVESIPVEHISMYGSEKVSGVAEVSVTHDLGSVRISSVEEHSTVINQGLVHMRESYTPLPGAPSITTRDGYTVNKTSIVSSSNPGPIRENRWTVEAEDITLGYESPKITVELPERTPLVDMGPRPTSVLETTYIDTIDFTSVPLLIEDQTLDEESKVPQYFVGEIRQPSERYIPATHVKEYVPLPVVGERASTQTLIQRHSKPMVRGPPTPLVIHPARPNYPLVPELVMSESQSIYDIDGFTVTRSLAGNSTVTMNVPTVGGYYSHKCSSMETVTEEESSSLESVTNLQSLNPYSRENTKSRMNDLICMNQCL